MVLVVVVINLDVFYVWILGKIIGFLIFLVVIVF